MDLIMHHQPLVSIITPVYNSFNTLNETVKSIISQTYQNWELFLIDDQSADRSVELCRTFAKNDERITVIELQHNKGAGAARNAGIKAAKGQYIAFLDSDDQWKPTKLETQIKFMQANQYDFTYTYYDQIERQAIVKTIKTPDKLKYADLLRTNWIGCLTAIYDVERLGKVFMPDIRKGQDYLTWLSILKKIDYAYAIKESLSIYFKKDHSNSSNKIRALKFQWIIYRRYEKLGIISSLFYLLHYIYFGIKKHI
jgi:teichuronic acid biosynthesis glycosyltransferase TuaG